jgi:hypothetical protein
MRSLRTLAAAALAATLTGCGAGGAFGLGRVPSGDITITDTLGQPVTTSWAKPYSVSTALFSITMSEKNFGGPWNVQIVRTSGNTNCFTASTPASSPNLITFDATNAGPNPTGDVCSAGEEEQALISDGDGHSVYFNYLLTVTITQATSLKKQLYPF